MAASERDRRVGRNVATLRGKQSQQSLADAMRAKGHRWSQATVWSVEQGERPVKFSEALDLADIFECKVDDLAASPSRTRIARVLWLLSASADSAERELQDAALRYRKAVELLQAEVSRAPNDAESQEQIKLLVRQYQSPQRVVMDLEAARARARHPSRTGVVPTKDDDGQHPEAP